jgi:hypothetical protein
MINKLSFFIITLIASVNLYGQVLHDFNGKAYMINRTIGAEGSPFLFEQWKSGTVFFKNGIRVDNLLLKFDAERNMFLYNQNDSLYEFIDELAEVRIYEETGRENDSVFVILFKNNIPTDNKIRPGEFVQVLCSGKITLLKQYVKKTQGENRNEGYTRSVKQYVLRTTVWAVKNAEVTPIKFSSSSLEELTSDKKIQVDNYIKTNRVNMKSERGFVSAIAYYNSIWKQ